MKISNHLAAIAGLAIVFGNPARGDAGDACSDIAPPPLPSTFEYAIDYQQALYTWINCFSYKSVAGVRVDKEVRQTGPFVALKDYGVHPAVRIWYSPEIMAWLEAGRPTANGRASPGDLPDGAFIIKEMFMSPADIYGELAATPPFRNDTDGEAFEGVLEALIGSWTIMIKDRNGPSADGWYWAQAEPNPDTVYANPPNYNPVWLDNYTSTELPVYRRRDNGELEIPAPHFIYSGFSTGTCIRCHASSSGESTFSTLDNIDPDRLNLQFRVDNSWRSEAYLDPADSAGPTLIDKLKAFSETIEVDGKPVTIDGEEIFDRYLEPIWYLPANQRPWRESEAAAVPNVRTAHLPGMDAQHDKATDVTAEANEAKATVGNGDHPRLNPDFVAAFDALTRMDQPTKAQIERFSFPPAFADHSFRMKPNPGEKLDNHPTGPMTPEMQQYITSDNCIGCHGGLAGAPSGVSQFLLTGPKYGDGYNVSPYGEWRWSPMGLAGRDPIFHSQIETEQLILLKENGLLAHPERAEKLAEVRVVQQALVDTCLRCHGAMGLRQKGLNQTPEMLDAHAVNTSKSNDPVQQYLTRLNRPILNPQFDLNDFYRTVPPSAETRPFEPWPNPPAPPPAPSEFSGELGNLAREGISCTVCHHIAPPSSDDVNNFIATAGASHPDWIGDEGLVWTDQFFAFLATNNSGLYQRSEADRILGPLDDVRVKPMQHALGLTPQIAPSFDLGTRQGGTAAPAEPFTRDSAMCGTCHTINLPNIGQPLTDEKNPVLRLLQPNPVFQEIPHSIEQATYLEWLNSDFGPGLNNEIGDDFQSCQDCHMPNRSPLDDPETAPPLAAQIATIQDSNYPFAAFQLPSAEIDVPVRSDYSRHELVGLNGFMIKMFEQHPDVLNVNLTDIETSNSRGAELAVNNMIDSTTQGRVATLTIGEPKMDAGGSNLVVEVRVENRTGHRFPSGVAFRRVWIDFRIKDAGGADLWSSGRSNDAGIIVDENGERLPTEFLRDPNLYQHHYQEICSQDRVQIYEELVRNAQGEFTTSFVHRVDHVKDNRLMPRGWVPGDVFAGGVPGSGGLADQGELLREIMRATDPDGVGSDPDFNRNPGGDSLRYRIPLGAIDGAATVEATLYSQAVTPAWFWDRFSMANEAKEAGYDTPATDRLYYLASTLNLENSPLDGWKFKVATSAISIPGKFETTTVPAACNQPYPASVDGVASAASAETAQRPDQGTSEPL